MQERNVEVAVGFSDHTWREIWVKVPQDPDHILKDAEVSTKAHDIVMTMANENGWNVAFIYIIYVESPDDMDEIV